MINEVLKLLVQFVVLAALQVLILNNIQLSGFINPYIYILFILQLPVKFPRIPSLLLAFAAGIIMDMFSNTQGMHAAATVAMAYMRYPVLRLMAPRDGYDSEAVPGIRNFGLQWFLTYSSILVLIHHFVLFYAEVFRFSEFFSTLLRVLLSVIATLLLIIIGQFLVIRNREER